MAESARRLGWRVLSWPLGLPLIVLLPLFFGSLFYALNQFATATAWVTHTKEVRIALERLVEGVLDVETNERGFLLTNNERFLSSYQAAKTDLLSRIETVRLLTADNHLQQERLQLVESLARSRVALLEEVLRAHRAGRPLSELKATFLAGSDIMMQLQEAAEIMRAGEERLEAQRVKEERLRGQVLFVVMLVGTFLLGGIGIGALVRWRGERERVAEHERFAAVLDGIDEGITLQDRSGKLVFANPAAARVIGFSSVSELLAAPLSELMSRFQLFAADGRPLASDELPGRAAMEGRQGQEILVQYRVGRGGPIRWSRLRAAPLRDASGQVIQAINIFSDVTEKHREEQRRTFLLGAVEQFNSSLDYQLILTNIVHQIVPELADWCAVDIWENGQPKRLAVAHIDPEKIALVQAIQRRYPADPRAPGSLERVFNSKQAYLLSEIPSDRLRASARDAEHLALIEQLQLCSYLAVPILSHGQALGVLTLAMAESGRHYNQSDLEFGGTFADRAAIAIENSRMFRTTELALARETEARVQAEQAMHFSDIFVGILGHDLRNPLHAIATTAQLLSRLCRDEQQQRLAGRINSSTDRMARMIDQLLDVTRIRIGGGLKLSRSQLDLGALAQQIIEETEAGAARTVTFAHQGQLDGSWDGDRLQQVLSNLLSNAARHGAAGRPITLSIDGRDSAAIMLEVKNQGAIPAALLPQIFEPFRSSSTRGRLDGLGLGLFITRAIVETHGGSIAIQSDEIAGTTVAVHLPRWAMSAS